MKPKPEDETPIDLLPCPRCGTFRPPESEPCWICYYPHRFDQPPRQKPRSIIQKIVRFVILSFYFYIAAMSILIAIMIAVSAVCLGVVIGTGRL